MMSHDLNKIFSNKYSTKSIPACAGIGLRAEHYQDVLGTKPKVGWFEVHSENYFGSGGRPHYYLDKIRQDYPLSLHGVGLSIGSTDPLNEQHLQKLKLLIQQYQPGLVSEHLSWGSFNRDYFNDLLPLPYTAEALDHMVDRVSRIQEYLGQQILIENISSYMQYSQSTIPEWEFLAELANKSGCGILLDVNNIYVNASNHKFEAQLFIDHVSTTCVKEIHLAGHSVNYYGNEKIIIDSHDNLVCDEVWKLYKLATQKFTQVPTLIEWDSNIPTLDVLISEASKADSIMENHYEQLETAAI